jgi:hypothetical protein
MPVAVVGSRILHVDGRTDDQERQPRRGGELREPGGAEGIRLRADGKGHGQPCQRDDGQGPCAGQTAKSAWGHEGAEGGGRQRADDQEPAGMQQIVDGRGPEHLGS